MKLKLDFLVVLLIGTLTIEAKSEPYSEITSIEINNKVIPTAEYNQIVIRTIDTITFKYEIEELPKNAGQSYYYRIVLRNSKDSSFNVTGVNIATYSNLNEDNFVFSFNAFDLRGSWIATTKSISFRVNNREANLLEELQFYKDKAKELESKKESTVNSTGIEVISIVMGLIIGLLIGATTIFVIMKLISSKQNKTNKGKKEMESQDTLTLSKEEHSKLLTENSNLRAEIAALRGQIDALQTRSVQMKKQNNDLQESLNKISNSKNELEKLQQEKDELFALIIHDIKNPAALIKSLVELLRSYDLSAVEQLEIINDIAETTTRIVALSHEVSKILALETSRLMLDIQPAQVSEIVEDVARRNTIAATNKNITVTKDISANLPDAEIDVQKIEEVVDNLISNAIKFTQNNGKIHLRAFVENHNIVVEISDNGLGLSETDVKSAFQRGSRLSSQPTAGESSTGLGLWIVKKLIDAHNGRVWVKSSIGKGSTFAFSIPLKHFDSIDN